MTAQLLDGEAVAARIKMQLAERVQRLLGVGRVQDWAQFWWVMIPPAFATWR